MKTVRVSKSIMDALNVKGYAEGKKFVYVVHDKLSQNCIEVMRFPRCVRVDSIKAGVHVYTSEEARRKGIVEFIQVKGA